MIAVRFAPDEIVRLLRAGSVELTERITVALDHGLVCWSIVADAPLPIMLRWSTPLPALPTAPLGAPGVEESPAPVPAHPPAIRLGDDSAQWEVTAYAGVVSADQGEAGQTRCRAQADRMLRLVFAGGSTIGELERSLEAFHRRRLGAFRQDRILHARRLEQRLTALESADPTLDRAFHWAKLRLDSAVIEVPGVGRWPRLPGDPVPAHTIAAGALLVGNREIALDLLRLLARSADASAAARREVHDLRDPPPGLQGATAQAEAMAQRDFLVLLVRYADWTGDLAGIEPLLPSISAAIASVAGCGLPAPWHRLRVLAQAGGWPQLVEAVARPASDAGRAEPSTATEWDSPVIGHAMLGFRPERDAASVGLLLGVVEGLWGVAPDALRAGLAVRPRLPPGWPEMALRRLRIGASLLDLRLRRRPGRLVLRVELVQGPRLRLVAELPRPAQVEQVLVNDEPLGGSRAVFDVESFHEVAFHLAEV